MQNNSPNIKSPIDTKTSIVNFAYNSVILLLAGIILFLIYSIILKFTKDDKVENVTVSNVGKPSEVIQVEVLNASDVAGVADRFTEYLRNNKFDVVGTGNYPGQKLEQTLVIDRKGNIENAKMIAKQLGIKELNVIQQLNDDYLLDVSVIVGKDYYTLNPNK